MSKYPPDSPTNHPDDWTIYDDGTMPNNVKAVSDHLIGKRITKAEQRTIKYTSKWNWQETKPALVLTLDNGEEFALIDTNDCCAYTELQKFLLHPENIDHAITAVETTNGYTKWHILADLAEIMELDVSWSAGNPFYYGYGFDLAVSKGFTEIGWGNE